LTVVFIAYAYLNLKLRNIISADVDGTFKTSTKQAYILPQSSVISS